MKQAAIGNASSVAVASMHAVSSLLAHDSVKIRAKALWLLGEMSLAHPESVHGAIPAIAAFLDSPEQSPFTTTGKLDLSAPFLRRAGPFPCTIRIEWKRDHSICGKDNSGGVSMEFKDLTPEQQEKVRGCKNAEELIAVAREEGHELSDDELQAISGGDWDCWDVCSKYQVPNTCDTHCPLFGMPR